MNPILIFLDALGALCGSSLARESEQRGDAPSQRPNVIFIAVAGVCKAPVDLMSIYPTLCGLAGIEKPAWVAGHDIRPLLANPATDAVTAPPARSRKEAARKESAGAE